ncbi:MAG: hypothetical protein IT560_11205 [Alphaproteobacteria bacterium]|nr:hypothetical protein [Alphaproteobacteria bacterium]
MSNISISQIESEKYPIQTNSIDESDLKNFINNHFANLNLESLKAGPNEKKSFEILIRGDLPVNFSLRQFYVHFTNFISGLAQRERDFEVKFQDGNIGFFHLDGGAFKKISFSNCVIRKLESSYHIPISIGNGSVLEELRINSAPGQVNLSDCQIKNIRKHTDKIDYKSPFKCFNVAFGEARGEVDFSSVHFDNELIFEKCLFKRAPLFSGTLISFETLFKDCKFADVENRDSVERWSTLKHLLQEKNFDAQAQEFHAAEVESKRKRIKFFSRSCWEKVSSIVLFLISDYGRNSLLSPVWLFILGTLCSCLYYYLGVAQCNMASLDDGALWLQAVCRCDGDLYKSVIYSGLQSLGPLGIIYSDTAFGPATVGHKLISFIHFLLASIIWFIWIFQTRAKFKL